MELEAVYFIIMWRQSPYADFFKKPFLLGAHRGGKGLYPENTAFAFQETAKRFPDCLLETDATMTRDGQIILLHDDTVDRTTNGKGKPGEMTLKEIQSLDAGFHFTKDGGQSHPYRGKGIKIPTLQEALRAAPKSRFLIDIKGRQPEETEAIIRAIREVNAERRTLLASFIADTMKLARRLAPEIPTCYDFTTGASLLAAIRSSGWESYQPQAQVVSLMKEMVPQFKLTHEEIGKLRAKGIYFQIHTLDTRQEMEEWLRIGVDSILTSHPEMLFELIKAQSR